MKFTRSALIMVLLFALAAPLRAAEGDWPNFRGPNYDGISRETGLKTNWTEPIPLVWEKDVGPAFSSFACVDGKVYTCGTKNDRQVLFCLKADTGETVWEAAFEKQYMERQGGDGTRATPAVNEGRVYVFGATGKLACFDTADGKEIWSANYTKQPTWGYSGSVLVDGDLAIVSPGGPDGSLAAHDKKTGKVVWKCGSDPAGYATPYPFTFDGKRYIAGFTGTSAMIAEAANGREVWRMPWKTDWDVNASAPIFHEGNLFFSSGYGHGCILLKLRDEGDKLKADEVWQSSVLRNKFQSCILYEDHLYTSDEEGLKCVEFMTGQEKWQLRRQKHGTIVLADGHLYYLTEGGQLQIIPASPSGAEPVTKADILDGRCWTVPVIYQGRIYARNTDRLTCFDLTP